MVLGPMASAVNFGDRLDQAIIRSGSVVCVGLDPRLASLPPMLRPQAANDWAAIAEAYEIFCNGIIDAVASHVGVVKPQAAFFEELGPVGMVALGRIIRHAVGRGLLVIFDGKRNDIGTTAEAYARGYLGEASPWGCDALTVSPYLGQDSIEPFVTCCDRSASGIFVLVKTSNPGGGMLQDRITISRPLYGLVADLLTRLNETRLGHSGYGPVGAVVGATYPEQLLELRATMPTSPILIPGFGAQGGAADDVAGGFDKNGRGAVVNSSRHILFAYERPEYRQSFGPDNWQGAAEAATIEMNQQLNSVRPLAGC
jgi:orotidine-5'-phosphate decarboxylase